MFSFIFIFSGILVGNGKMNSNQRLKYENSCRNRANFYELIVCELAEVGVSVPLLETMVNRLIRENKVITVEMIHEGNQVSVGMPRTLDKLPS